MRLPAVHKRTSRCKTHHAWRCACTVLTRSASSENLSSAMVAHAGHGRARARGAARRDRQGWGQKNKLSRIVGNTVGASHRSGPYWSNAMRFQPNTHAPACLSMDSLQSISINVDCQVCCILGGEGCREPHTQAKRTVGRPSTYVRLASTGTVAPDRYLRTHVPITLPSPLPMTHPS